MAIAVASFGQMHFTYAHVEVNNCIFGADTVTYFNALGKGSYLAFRVHKHAAAVVAIAAIAKPLTTMGVEPLVAGLFALAVIQGSAALLIFALLRRHFGDTPAATILTMFVFASFGTATLSGIAETYGVTMACIALACLLFGEIAPLARRWPLRAAIAAGATAAMPALANAPAAIFVVVYYAFVMRYLRNRPHSEKFIQLFVPAALAISLSILPALVAEGAQGSHWQVNYLNRYANWTNFTDPKILADYAVSVLIFSWVGPLDWLQCRYLLSDLVTLMAHPLRFIALLATITVLVGGLYRAFSSAMRGVSIATLCVASVLALFYLYFNPDEALLYSPQWILALVLAAAPGIADSRAHVAAAAVATSLLLAVNVGPLRDPRSHDPTYCCQVPPSTMRPNEMPDYLKRQGKVIER
ncbi:hypothetical protein [Sphingopyxis kveilinensis]|uniref:hypothetical protein n=1 Tax=Sphingopyxis kveilinensis TaxID=3114367 RepID=UPI0030CE43B0